MRYIVRLRIALLGLFGALGGFMLLGPDGGLTGNVAGPAGRAVAQDGTIAVIGLSLVCLAAILMIGEAYLERQSVAYELRKREERLRIV
ncbi:hypothetical protein D6789_03750 [Candidatus Woesearchaeota archaeon]|nr:MAG: hypothetical protein D6789_03750 [Candidatus Woesearchaeota archaeon]